MAAGDVKYATYPSATDITVTNLHSVASTDPLLGGWESGEIDNTTNKYTDYGITATIITGTPIQTGLIRMYVVRPTKADGTYPAPFDGTQSVESVGIVEVRDAICKVAATTVATASASVTYYLDCPSVAAVFGGNLPPKFVIFIAQSTGANLAAAGNIVTIWPSFCNIA